MCGDYNLRREKRYVEVDVRFTPDGKIRPLAINYDKAHTYGIDRVLAVKHGTSRFGVKGHCFTCLICGQKRNLWLEQGKWFVEAYRGQYSEERLVRALSGVHPMELYRISRDNPAKLPGWRRYIYPIYTTYNGKCRKDALPMKF